MFFVIKSEGITVCHNLLQKGELVPQPPETELGKMNWRNLVGSPWTIQGLWTNREVQHGATILLEVDTLVLCADPPGIMIVYDGEAWNLGYIWAHQITPLHFHSNRILPQVYNYMDLGRSLGVQCRNDGAKLWNRLKTSVLQLKTLQFAVSPLQILCTVRKCHEHAAVPSGLNDTVCEIFDDVIHH